MKNCIYVKYVINILTKMNSRQKVYIKILDPIPDEFKDLKRLEKLQENFQENFV